MRRAPGGVPRTLYSSGMSDQALYRAIYCSKISPAASSQAVGDILRSARKNNPAKDITGVLLFSDRRFIQILEGTRDQIDQILKVIGQDDRHYDMEVFTRSAIAARSFPDWSMAYIGEQADITEITGLLTVEDVIDNLRESDGFLAGFIAGCRKQLAGT